MTNLLFPTDFTTNTTAVLDWVRLFARKTGATITLLHVYQPMLPDSTLPTVGDPSLGGNPGLGVTASHDLEIISRERLNELATALFAEGLSVQVEWRVGTTEDEILDAARQYSADLIVMGRSDLSTFFDRLAGSAVSDVTAGAVCPVLIVPSPAEGQAVRPAQVRTIAYAMQTKTTQSDVSAQTDSLVDAFDAHLVVQTEDKLDHTMADLFVMQLYPQSGLDSFLHPNRAAKLIEQSEVPVLVYQTSK